MLAPPPLSEALPMDEKQAIRPSQWYYLLGAAVILAGVSLFVYSLLHGIFHITDNLTQIVVPGEKDITLLPKLKYTIFLEEQSVVDGRIFSTNENLSGLTCHVNEVASGSKIDLRRSNASTTYNVNGRSGRSVLEFVTEGPGVHHIACDYEEGKQGPRVVLAIGSGVTENIFSLVMTCLAEMIGGGVLGAAIILFTFFKRERSRKQIAGQPLAPG
jgi:hypothetical protein